MQKEIEGFQAEITKERRGKYQLLTSHNGYQWAGGGLTTVDELKVISDSILEFLESENAKI